MIELLMSQSLATLLSATLAGAFLWMVAAALYRITLHPLAKFPGPKIGAITGWYAFFEVARGRNHLFLQGLHEQYGDVVRYAPDKLSYRTLEALHDIYVDRKANNIKSGFTDINAKIVGSYSLQSLTDKHLHAQRRRTVAHAFTDDALRSSESFILNRVRIWCDLLGRDASKANDGWTPARNMKKWLQFLTLDILGDLCFGQSFQSIEKQYNPMPDMVDAEVRLEATLAALPIENLATSLFVSLNKISGKIGLELAVGAADFHAQIGRMVQERMALQNADGESADNGKRHDMFHYLLEAQDPETGEKLSLPELIKEAGLLVGAGYDTSVANMDACLWYLLRSPAKLRKLQQQLRTKFADVEQIHPGPELTSIEYLRACIDEGLRIATPAPGVLQRTVQPGGMTIEGKYVPAGTKVAITTYALHHNEKYYPGAWTYTPERWRPSKSDKDSTYSDEQVQQAKKALMAFSAGSRNCLGKNLAYLTMTVALARLLFLYDLRLQPGDHSGEGDPSLQPSTGRHRKGEYQVEDFFLTRRAGTKVELKLAERCREAFPPPVGQQAT